ncbi:MAG: hypothetical protein WCK57_07555 [Verrucomicrobiae bacterium]
METKEPNQNGKFKAMLAFCGACLFFILSVHLFLQAKHFQSINQPMPNSKGGFMSPSDGYLVGAALFSIAALWFWTALKFWRGK